MNPKLTLYSIPIDTITSKELYPLIDSHINDNLPLSIFNINVHAFNWYFRNPDFASTIQNADVVICDSDVIRLMVRFFKHSKIEKLTGSRWVLDYFRETKLKTLRIFLLGDETEVLEICKRNLVREFPEFVIDYHHGFFSEQEESDILIQINSFGADLLIVGMGMPKQELFLQRNHGKIKSAIRIPIGGAFRYWSGLHRQAPAIMLMLNLEWLHRIYLEPVRLTGRYISDAFGFLFNLIRHLYQSSGRTASK